jgi:H+-translocating NAD(P) transhydrogenase subunit alpha
MSRRMTGTVFRDFTMLMVLGFVAMMLAAVNIFGGFTVTHRMLARYKKKK